MPTLPFDYHLNITTLILTWHKPYATLLDAAGYRYFPQYCASLDGHLRTFHFAIHTDDMVTAFVECYPRDRTSNSYFHGVPILYCDKPHKLIPRLQRRNILP